MRWSGDGGGGGRGIGNYTILSPPERLISVIRRAFSVSLIVYGHCLVTLSPHNCLIKLAPHNYGEVTTSQDSVHKPLLLKREESRSRESNRRGSLTSLTHYRWASPADRTKAVRNTRSMKARGQMSMLLLASSAMDITDLHLLEN